MSKMDLDTMAAAIKAIPAPEMRFEPGYRGAYALWVGEPDVSGHRPAIEVTAHHFKDSRTYVVNAQPMTVEESGDFRTSTYEPFTMIRLHVERADRYSAKALQTLHKAWVAKVRAGDAGPAVEAALASVLGRDPR